MWTQCIYCLELRCFITDTFYANIAVNNEMRELMSTALNRLGVRHCCVFELLSRGEVFCLLWIRYSIEETRLLILLRIFVSYICAVVVFLCEIPATANVRGCPSLHWSYNTFIRFACCRVAAVITYTHVGLVGFFVIKRICTILVIISFFNRNN